MESHIVSLDTLTQSINVVGKIIPLFVWVLSGVCVAVVSMGVYIVKLQKIIANLQRESTVALTKNNMLIESNNRITESSIKSMDRLTEYFMKKGK